DVDRLGEADGAVDNLAFGVDETDDGGGGVQHPLREQGEAIESGIGRRVEQPQAAHSLESSRIADHPFSGIHSGRTKIPCRASLGCWEVEEVSVLGVRGGGSTLAGRNYKAGVPARRPYTIQRE